MASSPAAPPLSPATAAIALALLPLAGGLLASQFGWRSTLVAVGCVAGLALLFIARAVPETNRRLDPHATRFAPLALTASSVLHHSGFRAWAMLTACTYGRLFTILAAPPFVYIEVLGVSPAAYGVALASGSVSYLLGTLFCRRWLPSKGLTGAVRRGVAFTAAGGFAMLLAALLEPRGTAGIGLMLVSHWLYGFGHGIHQPCGQTGAVGPFPRSAGVASALSGFLLALTAFVVGQWLGFALDASMRPMALTVAFWAFATSGVGLTLVQRHGGAFK